MSQPTSNQKGIVKQFLLEVSAAAFQALPKSFVWQKVSKAVFNTNVPIRV